jgi:hypothetical protein
MLNKPDLQPNATINRWIQGILLFDFTLIHVPADKFKGPDALSRCRLGEGEEVPEEDDSWLDEIALFAGLPPVSLVSTEVASLDKTNRSKEDKVLLQIYHFLTTLEVPEIENNQQRHRFIKRATKFFVRNNELYKRNGVNTPLRAIIDLPVRYQLLEQAHENLGHRGEQAVFQTLHKRFYWPNL